MPVGMAAEASSLRSSECLRILHLSDTHGMHRTLEHRFGPLPAADILVHTGDFTDAGTKREFVGFDTWLSSLRSRYPHVLVVFGNHEYEGWLHDSACAAAEDAILWPDGQLQRRLLPNAEVLEHEQVTVRGIRFYGSPWCAWHRANAPGDARAGPEGVHRFGDVPEGVDVLLSHGAPWGIFDRMETTQQHWGGSKALRRAIEQVRPTAHLFGHIHEQRGVWRKPPGADHFVGGVEYELVPGVARPTFPPPPPSYPCELVSCNAMANHPGMEGTKRHLAGPARLILATRRGPDQPWTFTPA